jgi:hypothetical protein
VSLSFSDVSAAGANSYPVNSVNGKTGAVILNAVDITAAAATHTHTYVDSLNSISGPLRIEGGSNVSVSVSGNTISISAAGNTNAVAAVLWPAFILGG